MPKYWDVNKNMYSIRKNPEKHGMTKSRLYTTWVNMRDRCYNKNCHSYKHYGKRGIQVCEEWKNSFSQFKDWAMENGYSDSLTLDRIDTNGDYNPDNCKWSTNIEQQNNKRNNKILEFNGQSRTISEWSRITGLSSSCIQKRISKWDWSVEKALTTPVLAIGDQKGKRNKRSKSVLQFLPNGTFIKEWCALREIQRSLGFAASYIGDCCKGKRETAYGFKWEYKEKGGNFL